MYISPTTCALCGKPATQYVAVDIAATQSALGQREMQPRCAEHGWGSFGKTTTLEADNARLRAWQAEAVVLLREDVDQGTDDGMCFHCDNSDVALTQSDALGMNHQPHCRMQRILNHIAAAEEAPHA